MSTDLLTLRLPRPTTTPVVPPGVRLGTLEPGDGELLAQAYLAAHPPGVAAQDLAEAREEMTSTFRGDYGDLRLDASATAWVDDHLAGAVMVVTHSIWDEGLVGPFIIDLFTAPRARGRGTGRALVQHAVHACGVAGDVALSLRFGDGTSEAAMALYRDLGFAPVHAR